MTPNIFSLYVCLLLLSLVLRSRHHQNDTITTLPPWPSFRRYLSTKQARSTTPLHSKQPYYTREHVCSFIRQLHLIAASRGLRKPAHRSHELCAPSARSISTKATKIWTGHLRGFVHTARLFCHSGKWDMDCRWCSFPSGAKLAPRSTIHAMANMARQRPKDTPQGHHAHVNTSTTHFGLPAIVKLWWICKWTARNDVNVMWYVISDYKCSYHNMTQRTQQPTGSLAVKMLIRHIMAREWSEWIGWIKKQNWKYYIEEWYY